MCGIWILHRKTLYIYITYCIQSWFISTQNFTWLGPTLLSPQFPPAQWKVNTQIHGRHHSLVYRYLKNRVHRSCIFYKALLTRKISDPYLKRHHAWTQLRRLPERDFDVISGRIWSTKAACLLGRCFQENPSISWRILSGQGWTDKRVSQNSL